MTKKPIANVGASVRQRLLNLRNDTGEDAHVLFTQFAIERFLYRLSQSSLARRFVLKGAMLFRVWSGSLHRPTKDVDLLGFGESTPESVAAMIHEIINTSAEDDGISFDAASIQVAEIRENDDYGGIRATCIATLDQAVIPLQVDIGFGDAITPTAVDREYPVLIGMAAPRLRMYPVETVIAEKLEAAVKRGMINSRMKDFYDLLVIFRSFEYDEAMLARAIGETFTRRGTPLPQVVPQGLSDEFGSDPTASRRWREFLRFKQVVNEPTDFADVIRTTRNRLWPTIVVAESLRSPNNRARGEPGVDPPAYRSKRRPEGQSAADIRVSEGPEGPQRTSGGAAPGSPRAAPRGLRRLLRRASSTA